MLEAKLLRMISMEKMMRNT